MDLQRSDAVFATTRSSLLDALHADNEAARARAMDELTRIYWPAVYAFLRRQGRNREEAGEAAQAFFAEVAVGRALFDAADHEVGRVRNLVLTALRNHLTDSHRRAVARGGRSTVSLGDLDREDGLVRQFGDLSPEDAFERRWAVAAVQEAMARCERHFRESGKPAHWAAFEARVLRPALSGVQPVPTADLAAELEFKNGADVAAAVQVVRKRALAILREVVAATAATAEEEEEEFRGVLGLLA